MRFLLMIASLFVFSSCSTPPAPEAHKGELDLTHMNLSTPVQLNGPWEEFWGQLLPPGTAETGQPSERVFLPGVWNARHKHPAYGVVSYRLTLKLPPGPEVWGLKLPSILTSYRLYINGRLSVQAGLVGLTAQESSPQYGKQLVFFQTGPAQASQAELVLQVANFSYRKSGVTGSILLGTAQVMEQRHDMDALAEYLLLGALLILVVYYLALSFIRPADKASFWFGLFCLAVLVRLVATGDHTLDTLIPGFSWEIRKKLELLIFSWGAVPLVQFLRNLFPQELGKRLPRLLNATYLLMGLAVVLFPVKLTNNAVPLMELLVTIGFLLVLIPLGLAVRRKRTGALLVFFSLLVLAIAAIHDILYASLLISSFFILPYAFLAFVLTQTLLFGQKLCRGFSLGRGTWSTTESYQRFVESVRAGGFFG